MSGRVVGFVCPHWAAKSRIAAAWFNALQMPGSVVVWQLTNSDFDPAMCTDIHDRVGALAGTLNPVARQ